MTRIYGHNQISDHPRYRFVCRKNKYRGSEESRCQRGGRRTIPPFLSVPMNHCHTSSYKPTTIPLQLFFFHACDSLRMDSLSAIRICQLSHSKPQSLPDTLKDSYFNEEESPLFVPKLLTKFTFHPKTSVWSETNLELLKKFTARMIQRKWRCVLRHHFTLLKLTG